MLVFACLFILAFAAHTNASAQFGTLGDDELDLAEYRWTRLLPTGQAPVNLTGGAAGQYQGKKAFFLGGQVERWFPQGGLPSITFTDAVYQYSIHSNAFALLEDVGEPRPSARVYPAYASDEHKIYLYGGGTFNNSYGNIQLFSDFWEFNMNTRKYSKIVPRGTASPGGRIEAVLTKLGDDVYLFGGIVDAIGGVLPVYSNDLWKFSFRSRTWSLVTPAFSPSPRGVPNVRTLARRGMFFLNGGELFDPETFEFGYANDTWFLDGSTGMWTDITPSKLCKPDMPARFYTASFGFGRNAWAIYGGTVETDQKEGCGAPFPQHVVDELWLFRPKLDAWKHITWATGQKPPPMKRQYGLQIEQNSALIFSGFDFQCPTQTTPGLPGQVYNKYVYRLDALPSYRDYR